MTRESPSPFAVYDGRERLGSIHKVRNELVARDAKGKLLGRFKTLREAANVISERCSESGG
jgi:hypothetical protein